MSVSTKYSHVQGCIPYHAASIHAKELVFEQVYIIRIGYDCSNRIQGVIVRIGYDWNIIYDMIEIKERNWAVKIKKNNENYKEESAIKWLWSSKILK